MIWKYEGHELLPDKFTIIIFRYGQENVLTLQQPSIDQSGMYTCTGTLSNGQRFQSVSYLYIGSKKVIMFAEFV